jgi:hypothetical protein
VTDDTIKIKVKLDDAAEFAGETRVASFEIEGLGEAARRANKKAKDTSGFDKLKQSAKGLGSLVKPALIVGGIGLIVQAFNAATAGSVGFLGALLPLAGLLGALPAAALIGAQSLGVLKLAFSGVGGAVGGLNSELEPKKFEKLSHQGQQFALMLNSMKAPIRDLQRRVQNGLFPGLTKGLDKAKPALAALLGPLGATGGVLGGVGARLGGLIGSKGFAKDLGQQAAFNNVQLGRLGIAGVHVLDTLRQITVASRPLVSWLVRLAGGWAATADRVATADRANGKLTRDFRLVQHTTSDVFKVLWNLGKALFNIADVGRKHLGESLLGSLVKGSEALDRWTESGPGLAKITSFFEKAKPVVYAVALLIGTIVKDLLNFGQGQTGGLVSFAGKVRHELLPEFLKLSEIAIHIFGFVSKNVPGSSWLFTILYVLHKLGAGGLLGGVLSGVGKSLGTALGTKLVAGLLAEGDAFALAGTTLGVAFEGAFAIAALAATVILSKKLGELLAEALGKGGNYYVNPKGKPLNHHEVAANEARERKHMEAISRGLPWTPDQSEREEGVQVEQGGHGQERLLRGGTPHLHGPTLRAPATAEVKRVGRGREGEAATHIHTHVTLKLDSKPVAEGSGEVIARRKALQ